MHLVSKDTKGLAVTSKSPVSLSFWGRRGGDTHPRKEQHHNVLQITILSIFSFLLAA
jgi:hypothetical protein